MRVVGYVRRSKGDTEALGLARQRRQLREEADRRDWKLELREEIESAVRGRDRPVLREVIASLKRGDTLVVTRLDRLSRSVVDAGKLLELARRRGFNVVALDFGIDLGTPNGELVANVLTSVAQWETRIMGQRIKEALAEKRERGDPAQVSDSARRRILRASRRRSDAGRHRGRADARGVQAASRAGTHRTLLAPLARLSRAQRRVACARGSRALASVRDGVRLRRDSGSGCA